MMVAEPAPQSPQEVGLFERILIRLRDKIHSRQYFMTVHADEEMEDDGLSVFDVKRMPRLLNENILSKANR